MPSLDDIALENDLKQDALHDIAYFVKQPDGQANYLLACHASVSEVLTPEILYLIRDNFKRDIHGNALALPWMAVSDLLLSGLGQQIGHETFELRPYVRQELYKSLEKDPNFGRKRLLELSDFLLAYIRPLLRHPSPARQREAQRQRWVALSISHPAIALQEIAADYQGYLEQKKTSGQNYIRKFLERVPVRDAQLDILAKYVAGTTALAKGHTADAKRHLDGLGTQLKFGGTILRVPVTGTWGKGAAQEQDKPVSPGEKVSSQPIYPGSATPVPLAGHVKREQSALTSAIRQVQLEKPLSLLDLVNCDRQIQERHFRKWFRVYERGNYTANFCSIIGEPKQLPGSLAERLIYEISDSEAEDYSRAIFLVRRPDSYRATIHNLPLRYDLSTSQKEFQRFFLYLFNSDDHISFERFISDKLNTFPYRYIMLPFYIRMRDPEDWNLLEAYLEWIIHSFSGLSPHAPRLLFFFIFLLKDKKDNLSPVVEQINRWSNRFDNCTVLPSLEPVAREDLEYWLMETVGINNKVQIRSITEAFSNSLPAEKGYGDYFDMDEIEQLQTLIYSISNE